MVNVILVDDHRIIREGIKAILTNESNINVIAEAANGKELLQVMKTQRPHVAVIDINMPVMDGFETTRILCEQYPDVHILILTMLDEEGYLFKLFEAGAKGYVLKNAEKEELIYAVQSVARGSNFICSELAMNLLKKVSNGSENHTIISKNSNGFSKREMEVLVLIAEGYTNAEIAEKLFTSRRTIETHRQHLLDKTQVKNTAALISHAYKSGVLEF